ncbi:MAG: nitroreductase/quinone reductase family protein [Thaumarchaeota archaeon]|nr:nitroreductase/quinone reductase family protein [Nitrososphaerota archaeon]
MTDDDFRKALSSANELRITFVGRKTEKKFSTPVWFVNQGDKVYLLPVNGTASDWYKDVLKDPKMELQASGKKMTAKTVPITDKKRIEEVVEMFRKKYGAGDMKRYYPRTDAAVELSV